MNKTLVISIVALIVSIGAVVFPNTTTTVVETLGGGSGQNHSFTEFFDGGLSYGSGCYSTSTSGILLPRTLESNSCIYMTATGAGQAVVSLTLPATSTLSGILPATVGGCRSWWIDASDLAAATTTTVVKGTGWDLIGMDATGAGAGADVLDGAEFGMFTACRQKDSDITGYVTEWIAAD